MSNALVIEALRHGETEFGQCYLGKTDPPLSETGWLQMQNALKLKAPADYDAVYSSPLVRCRNFAMQWCADVSLIIEPRIEEYDFGDWDGKTAAEIYINAPDALARFWEDPTQYPPPNGELLPLFFARVQAFIAELQQSGYTKVLLITHGGVIKALQCITEAKPPSEMASLNVPHGKIQTFRIPIHE